MKPKKRKIDLNLKKLADNILSAFLKGKLPPKEVAQKLATEMELDVAREILFDFVEKGKISGEEANLIIESFKEKIIIQNSIAAASGVTSGAGAAISAVSITGSVTGLSASGITSGLATLGTFVGGGMAAGLAVTAGAGFVVGAGVFWVTKKSVKQIQKRIQENQEQRIQKK